MWGVELCQPAWSHKLHWLPNDVQVLRAAVIFLYLAIDAAAALHWLPLSCCLTQLLSVPAVRLQVSAKVILSCILS